MKFTFAGGKLKDLYETEKGKEKHPPEVVTAFFELTGRIRNSTSLNTLRNHKGARLEKLTGRRNEYSMRLNRQFRLIVEFEEHEGETWVIILKIEDYH